MLSRLSYRVPQVVLLLGLLCSASSFSQNLSSPRSSNGKYALDRILVKFRQSAEPNARSAAHAAIGAFTLRQYRTTNNLELVGLPAGLEVGTALRAYRMRPEVEYAEPDYTVHVLNTPNDRGGGGGGGGSTSFNLTVQATADGVTKNIGIVKVTVP
jgi:hypothetical protein